MFISIDSFRYTRYLYKLNVCLFQLTLCPRKSKKLRLGRGRCHGRWRGRRRPGTWYHGIMI